MDNLWFGTEALRRMIYFTLAVIRWLEREETGEVEERERKTVKLFSVQWMPGSWLIVLLQQS